MQKKIKSKDTIYPLMGIDLSLNGTGIIVLEDSIVHKYIITNKCKTLMKDKNWATLFDLAKVGEIGRLLLIRNTVESIIEKHKPKHIALEDYSLGSTYSTISTGEIGGIIRLLIYEGETPLRLYEPTKVKKFCTGKGNAPKSAVCLNVYKNWKVDFSEFNELGEDLADAFTIVKMLETEVKLRSKQIDIKSLNQNVKEIFFDKSNKEKSIPIMEKEFILR